MQYLTSLLFSYGKYLWKSSAFISFSISVFFLSPYSYTASGRRTKISPQNPLALFCSFNAFVLRVTFFISRAVHFGIIEKEILTFLRGECNISPLFFLVMEKLRFYFFFYFRFLPPSRTQPHFFYALFSFFHQ